jgi:hypothetical protein
MPYTATGPDFKGEWVYVSDTTGGVQYYAPTYRRGPKSAAHKRFKRAPRPALLITALAPRLKPRGPKSSAHKRFLDLQRSIIKASNIKANSTPFKNLKTFRYTPPR